jgi:hypothetical protein
VAFPTVVQTKSGFSGPGNLTPTVTLDAPASADHAVVLCLAGDKDIGDPFDLDQAGEVDVDLRSASVSNVIAWYVATGGETVISGVVEANIAGGNLFALELEQDGDTGDWQLVAVGSSNSTEANTLTQTSGTTGAAIADGLAVVSIACDSVNTAGTPSWSNGATSRYASGNGSTQAGLWVSTADVAAAAPFETTLTRAGGTSDQHSGGVVVLGKVDAPDGAGVPFLVDQLGADATIAVEVAFGADVLGDPEVWPWFDVTEDVRADPAITTAIGRGDEAGVSQPAELSFVLDNAGGTYNLGGEGVHWPYVRQGTPVRVTIDPDDAGGGRVVVLAFAAAWVPGWDTLTGTVPVVTLVAAGTLRRLEQGQPPVASALRRALTGVESVKAYWPMEDGRDTVQLRAVEGGQDITYTGTPRLGVASSFNCSGPIADAGKDGAFTANVTPFPATGECQVRFLLEVPDDGVDADCAIAYVWTTGTLLRFDLVLHPTGGLSLFIYNADGSLNTSDGPYSFNLNGTAVRVTIEMEQDGTGVDYRFGTIRPTDLAAFAVSGSIASRSFLVVSQVQLVPLGAAPGCLFGHLTVQDELSSQFDATGALRAHAGEFASSGTVELSRMHRLCTENGVTLERVVPVPDPLVFLGDQDKMGAQLPGTLLALLRECETSDQGQFWDGRGAGLTYTVRRYREDPDGVVALTVAGDELAAGWTPTHDDQRITNRVTCTRLQGVVAVVEDVDGRRGTAAVGTYDSALTVNTMLDGTAEQHAAWRVALGTQEGYRVPAVTVDLRATPALAGAVLDVVPGDRLNLVDLDDTFAGWSASVGTIELIVEGIAHEITPRSWRVTFRCSPFSPWGVAEYAAATGDTAPLVWRVDTDGAQLAAGASIGATSLSVASTGALWTTTADDYPIALSVGGIRVVASACSGTSSPQTMTVAALPVARGSGAPVALWDPRPIGL